MADVISNLFIGVVSSLIVAFVLAVIAMRAFHAQKNRELKQECYVEYAKVATGCDYVLIDFSDLLNDAMSGKIDDEEFIKKVNDLRFQLRSNVKSIILLRGKLHLIASNEVRDAEEDYCKVLLEKSLATPDPDSDIANGAIQVSEKLKRLLDCMRKELKLNQENKDR